MSKEYASEFGQGYVRIPITSEFGQGYIDIAEELITPEELDQKMKDYLESTVLPKKEGVNTN